MVALAVCVFELDGGAERALRTLESLRPGQVIDVQDAAVVRWPSGQRKPITWQAGSLGGATGLSGAFWGLLFGILFLLPLAGPPGPADVSLTQIGVGPEFLARLRRYLTAGRSGLFLLVPETAAARIEEVVAADVLLTTLTAQQERGLRAAFGES